MVSLNVTISTHGKDGMKKVEAMNLPIIAGVNYIISWQAHEREEIPTAILERRDIRVFRFEKNGLSNNRNNAIDHADGDIILIGDDDLAYNEEGLKGLMHIFESSPELDFALFKVKFPREKQYPANASKISIPLPNNYYVSSVEMAFRRKRVADLRFFPQLGLGAPEMWCGEEEMFLYSALKRKLNVRFFDNIICEHPDVTTGEKVNREILKGKGYVIALLYPTTAFLRIILKAFRMNDKGNISFLKKIIYLSQGAMKKYLGFNKVSRCYKW